MTVATISKDGLAAMAVAVGLLWLCFGAERASVRRGNRDYRLAIREMRLLQSRTGRRVAHSPRGPTRETLFSEASL